MHEPNETELRAADEAGDALAAFQLGELLLRGGDLDGADAAFRRAEERGEPRGAWRQGFIAEHHRKDLVAAEAAYRRADAAGAPIGSGVLGELLRGRGELRAAEQAFRRCFEGGGSPQALVHYAGLLSQRSDATASEITEAVVHLCKAEDRWVLTPEAERDTLFFGPVLVLSGVEERCDPVAVEAGFRRADNEGSASGAFRLGIALHRRGDHFDSIEASRRGAERGYTKGWAQAALVLAELGHMEAAEVHARKGDEAEDGDAAFLLGFYLDEKGDRDGGLEAYRRADARGHANGAFNLAVELMNRGDLHGAEAAFERACERGADNAQKALEIVRGQRDEGYANPRPITH